MESINEDIMVSELAAIKKQFSYFVLNMCHSIWM